MILSGVFKLFSFYFSSNVCLSLLSSFAIMDDVICFCFFFVLLQCFEKDELKDRRDRRRRAVRIRCLLVLFGDFIVFI